MESFEQRFATALKCELEVIPEDLQPPPHAAKAGSGQRRRRFDPWAAALLTAAAVVVLVLSVVLAGRTTSGPASEQVARPADAPSSTASDPTGPVVRDGEIRYDGARIPIPQGWRVQILTGGDNEHMVCLRAAVLMDFGLDVEARRAGLSWLGDAETECLGKSGILIRIANTSGDSVEGLPGGFAHPECSGSVTPMVSEATVGGRPGSRIDISCAGSDSGSAYWQLPTGTFSIQTPSGVQEIGADLARTADLSQWDDSGVAGTVGSTWENPPEKSHR